MPGLQILLHEHDTQSENIKTNNKSDTTFQLDPNAAAWPRPPNDNISQSRSSNTQVLDQADLLDYMYQHVQFDEIPFSQDPLYDHRHIYTHENEYMQFGIYENVQATVAFEIEMEKRREYSEYRKF